MNKRLLSLYMLISLSAHANFTDIFTKEGRQKRKYNKQIEQAQQEQETKILSKFDQFEKMIREKDIAYIDFIFVSKDGELKGLTQPIKHAFKTIQNGAFFDGSSIPGFTSIDNSDLLFCPDLKSFRLAPYTHNDKNIGQMFCFVHESLSNPHPSDPRSILKNVLNRAHKMGYEFLVGPEIEFFLFEKDAGDQYIPVHKQPPCIRNLKLDLFDRLAMQNIDYEKMHCEVAKGQHEISVKYGDALVIADEIMLIRETIENTAEDHNMIASFLAKPIDGENGSGMHVHFSLYDTKNDTNAFYDDKDELYLSETAKKFIAGVLHHIDAITAFANSHENSYKRLVPGYEAPIYPCWGARNRSALIRIPFIQKDTPKATRAELRSPDSLCNPYLLFAAMLEAGLDGIENNLELVDPVEENVYRMTTEERKARNINTLPTSLDEALRALGMNKMLRKFIQ